MQRRAEEQQKECEGAGVEAGNPGRGGRRVTAAEKKRKAELQVWLRRKPGALAPSFQILPSNCNCKCGICCICGNCITVKTLHDMGLHAAARRTTPPSDRHLHSSVFVVTKRLLFECLH